MFLAKEPRMLPKPALVYPRVQDPSLCPEWFAYNNAFSLGL